MVLSFSVLRYIEFAALHARLLVAFTLFSCIGTIFGMPKDVNAKINYAVKNKYKQVEILSSSELNTLGNDFYKRQKYDSAMVCFSIVANRYKETMTKSNKSLCAKAYYRCGIILLNRYSDYAKALQSMQNALDVATEADNNVLMSSIYIYIGNIYVFYADQHKSDEMMVKGYDMYRKSMHLSANLRQWDNLIISFCNICSCRPEYANILNIYDDVSFFKTIDVDHNVPLYPFVKSLADGMHHMKRQKYEKAIHYFVKSSSELSYLEDSSLLLRYQFIPECHVAECLAFMGNTSEAINRMHCIENRALALHLTDLMPEIYSRLEALYHSIGNQTREQEYRLKYLEIKDSLINGMGVEQVKDIHFLHELNVLDSQLAESAYQRERQQILIAAGCVVMAGILIILFVVYRKNRQLDTRNKILYQRMHEALQTTTSESSSSEKNTNQPLSIKQAKNTNTPLLSDEQKNNLMKRLRNLLSDTEILCTSNLTEQSLAKQLGSNSTYLSKVVNELCNCNFNTFINNLRVIEACKRFDDMEHYGHLSVEGIGISVGFNSRSTFSTAFKRVTGLTPSEYLRQSRKNA